MPPLNSRKVEALQMGTVKLSKPIGEMLSTKVATTATPIAERILSRTENEYSIEKKIKLIAKLKLAKNIAESLPNSCLLKICTSSYHIFRPLSRLHCHHMPYGKMPAATTYGLEAKNNARKV